MEAEEKKQDDTEVTDNSKIEGDFKIETNYNAEAFSNLQNEVKKLKDDFESEKNKIVNLKVDFEKSKYDLVTLLGVFVGLITYLGLEIQVFKTISNPLMIIGVSVFFIASILLFILSINTVIKKVEAISWNDFKNPLFVILIILFVVSIIFIIYGYKDFIIGQGADKTLFLNTYGF